MDFGVLLIHPNITVKEALKKMDAGAQKILFVVNVDNCLLGVVTDGDIRRYLLSEGSLEGKISSVYNRNPVCLMKNYSKESVKKLMLKKQIEVIPIVDQDKRISGVLLWTDLFGKENICVNPSISVPVVIMAGGKGERMGALTKILPKPLIPLGEKPILEIIMDKFSQFGVKEFYITLNYKGEMIKAYFEGTNNKYKLNFISEKKFLGTAGSLKLLARKLKGDFIVSNCDILTDIDYADLVKFHKQKKNILTVVGSIQHHTIPYGVIHYEKEGKVLNIQEKPEFDFTVNTGAYVLSNRAVDFVPREENFDMTDLIEVLLKKGLNVGVYPISEKSYIDIGQWGQYRQYLEKFIL